MKRRSHTLLRLIILTIVASCCVLLFSTHAHAEGTYLEQSGDGWSISANGVMTIESDQGWANCLKDGFEDNVRELIIGKDVTNFRMYDLPYDVPTEDFFGREDIIAHDRFGRPIYNFKDCDSLYPSEIVVETGNSVFQVLDGLLINTITKEVVLSETDISDVVVPEGIQSITRNAFDNRHLASIQLPDSLKEIGDYAFSDCDELKSIVLPVSVETIGDWAFSDCTSLGEVKLSKGLQQIGDYCFDDCAIQYIDIPESVMEIGAFAFHECEQLKQVELHAGLTKIDMAAFSKCSKLSEIDLPEGLTFLGDLAFTGCYSLSQMILPNSLLQVGVNTFAGCRLTVLSIPEDLDFVIYYRGRGYIVNPHIKKDKTFDLHSVDSVIFSGSDYDFGYPAINDAKNVYFLGLPPEDVGQILDRETTGNIYCPEEYKFEWTRSSIASWVRQKIQFLPSDQLKEITDQEINATPIPTNTPSPTPRPTKTPWPTPMPRPTASPAVTAKPQQQGTDPLVFAFAGILALVIAGIVVVAAKSRKPKKRALKRK